MSATANASSDNDVPETYNELQELTRGDSVTINGIEYRVVIQNTGMRSFFMPDFPSLVSKEGTTQDLAFGEIEDSDACGVMWQEDVGDNLTESDLLATYDEVEIQEGSQEDVYEILVSTEEDKCPFCGNDTSQFMSGQRNGEKTQELLKCNDSDNCGEYFLRERKLPVDDSAIAKVQDFNGNLIELELEGCYRENITSRFKLDPRSRDSEKWITATELAEKLEAKTTGEHTNGAVQQSNHEIGGGVVWKDGQYDWKVKIFYRSVNFS